MGLARLMIVVMELELQQALVQLMVQDLEVLVVLGLATDFQKGKYLSLEAEVMKG